MSSGSFDCLSSLDQALCEEGNEAESLVDRPRYCFVALRGWLETVLGFLEQKHAIPPLPADRQGKGEIQYRIDRLAENGVSISRPELSAMHDIRIDGNDGAHPQGNKHRFTEANAEAALRNAGMIRDWLVKQYTQPARAPQRVARSATSKRSPSPRLPSTAGAKTRAGGYGWKIAAGVAALSGLLAFVWQNFALPNRDLRSDRQVEDTHHAETKPAKAKSRMTAHGTARHAP